ncbi:unnamed protein product [Polarella glacialis]|uniref:MYND-type domain-containing protein n=1 Tax=Polarella glacialis TaxID=89957 RepID=A0A813GTY7_POLGL|nr:unnamed protein product [Polarella glacialis]
MRGMKQTMQLRSCSWTVGIGERACRYHVSWFELWFCGLTWVWSLPFADAVFIGFLGARELYEEARRGGVHYAAHNLGVMYHLAGDEEKARELYEEARRQGNALAAAKLGAHCIEQGETEKARELLEEALARTPGCEDAAHDDQVVEMVTELLADIRESQHSHQSSHGSEFAHDFGQQLGLKQGESQAGTQMSCRNCQMHMASPLRCGTCKAVFYCSRDYQRQDWRYHKRTCEKPALEQDTVASSVSEKRR